MNKRKPDDEFAALDLSFFKADGQEVIIYCPESKASPASQDPRKEHQDQISNEVKEQIVLHEKESSVVAPPKLVEKKIQVHYGDIGYGYDSFFGPYLAGAKEVMLEDPYIRKKHQVGNFVRFCEMLVKIGDVQKIQLITNYDNEYQKDETEKLFNQLKDSLLDNNIEFEWSYSNKFHDRFIIADNGWNIQLGRGLDYFQSLEGEYYQIGTNDMDLRKCLLTTFDFYKK